MRVNLMRNQGGDTIVEVLIAIAVVSLVLVTAYTTSTHSVNTIQDTQEHSEALQLAQTQIEYLHNVSKPARPVSGSCFDNTGKAVPPSSNPGNPVNSACEVDAGGNPTSSQPQFTIQVYNSVNPQTGLIDYKVQVTWPSLSTRQTDNVTLYYQQA